MLKINGLPAALINENTALVFDQAAHSVLIQRITMREDGTYASIESLRSFSTDSELAALESACFA
jgi:hypothetical protein